jgi:hypothetical protein
MTATEIYNDLPYAIRERFDAAYRKNTDNLKPLSVVLHQRPDWNPIDTYIWWEDTPEKHEFWSLVREREYGKAEILLNSKSKKQIA